MAKKTTNPIETQPQIASPAGGQAHISCPLELANTGIDTLYLSLGIEIPEEFIAFLKEKKSELQETTSNIDHVKIGETNLFSWNLQRRGAKFYPYVLRTGDITLSLSGRKADSTIPTAQLQIGSISCQQGLDDTLRQLERWMFHHKLLVQTEKVSRIDLCADIVCDIKGLDLLNRAKLITQASKFSAYWDGLDLTGVQIGRGNIVARIYDKIAEMAERQAGHKEAFYQEIWGGVSTITRVEFQLRREALKQFFLENSCFQVVKGKLSEMWRYLTDSWLRQAAGDVDRENRHQDRSELSPFWVAVQTAYGSDDKDPLPRNRGQKHINVPALINQAAGIMLTVCSAGGCSHDDFFGILAASARDIQNRLVELFDESTFERSFYSRSTNAIVTF